MNYMGDIENFVVVLRMLNETQRDALQKKPRGKLDPEVFDGESILGDATYKNLQEMIYRFGKMERHYKDIEEHQTYEGFLKHPDLYFKNINGSFVHLYNWVGFLAETVAYLLAIITYHNEELVRSVAPRKELAKYQKQMKHFKQKQEKIVNNILQHRPLDAEDKELILWLKRALDDSKREPVI